MRKILRKLLSVTVTAAVAAAAVVLTIMLFGAFQSRSLPDLAPWHTVDLEQEFRAGARNMPSDFDGYLELEQRLYQELDQRIHADAKTASGEVLNRFDRSSPSFPERYARNWNRSFELVPEVPRGGILLLHGLTDSPYSVRAIAEIFHARGWYVLAPRLPGHGTTPHELLQARIEDWKAVVRLAAERVREAAGADGAFLIGGYSNGGALAVQYTLDALEGSGAAVPDRVYLFSPAIGITNLAVFASWHRFLAAIPYFEKFRWMSIRPEYDPFKYNSFPKMGGHLTWSLTRQVQGQLDRLSGSGDLERMPPVLAFQSLVDSTIRTDSIVDHLFDRLPARDHALVLFDMNRAEGMREFVREAHPGLIRRLETDPDLPYSLTLITNDQERTRAVVERRREAGEASTEGRELGLAWPEQVYSLSHVAIPFSPDDSLYGDGNVRSPTGLHLGQLHPRGEKGALIVPVQQFMRLRFNPFFAYIEQRLVESLDP